MNDEDFMRLAIRVAQMGIAAGQTPFGAVVVRDGSVVAEAHNTVWRDCDPTAHAEIGAIRRAAATLGRIDLGGLRDVYHLRAVPDVPVGNPLVEDRRGALRGDHPRRAGGRVPRVVRPGGRPGGNGRQPAASRGRPLGRECADLFAQWKAAGLSAPY